MDFKQTIILIVSSIASLGVLAGGIGYLVSSFKKGSKKEKDDVISSAETLTKFWQEQAEGYKLMNSQREAEWNDKFQAMSREIGELRGELNAESKQKKEYLDILQNRDPESKKFMEMMINAAEKQSEVNKEVVRVLGEIHAMTKEEHDREVHIEATVTKT